LGSSRTSWTARRPIRETRPAFREALATGEDILIEAVQYRKDGSRFWSAVSADRCRMKRER
jgi:hypothetical protein